jgi:intein/homing endonuclease
MLQEYTRYSKYSRYLPELKRRETWEEQINRVFNMHEVKLGDSLNNFRDDFEFAKTMVLKKRVLGSQRALQFGGKPILDKNAKLYNCTVSYVDRVRFFQECMYLLLCGCGVGFSVQTHHVKKLPNIEQRKNGNKTYVIPDTIEGWADAIGVLLSSYFVGDIDFKEYHGFDITFDYTKIRPAGAPLSWGGKAPGPKGLKQSIEKIDEVLKSVLSDNRYILKPIEVYDIIMHMSDAVISGGVRRSATICIFSPEDSEMLNAKTGDWFIKNPQRGRSNNSALLIRDETKKEDFENIMKSVKEFGEPGFIWAEDKETLYNPCITKDSWITTSKGAFQVKDLIGKQFEAIVDGKKYSSTEKGFFYTGEKDVYEVETVEGFKIKSTLNHKFLIQENKELVWKELDELEIGDKIVIHNHEKNTWEGNGTFGEGWLLGNLFGDGVIGKHSSCLDYWGNTSNDMKNIAVDIIRNEESIKKRSDLRGGRCDAFGYEKNRVTSTGVNILANDYDFTHDGIGKHFGEKIEKTSSDFYKGFIRGWFDADGSVQGNIQKGFSVRLSSISLKELEIVQRMLLRLGIYSKIYKDRRPEGLRLLPDSNRVLKEYFCQTLHELVISRDCIQKFNDIIGFYDEEKQNKLNMVVNSYTRTPYKTNYIATIKSVDFVKKEDVYDCTINEIHAFDANGFYVHNCVEICMQAYDAQGVSGWQFCNLCELNMKKCKTKEDFLSACKAAAIIGTIQASYDSFEYLGKVTEDIVKREALLGCSMTGMMDNPEIAFDKDIQKQGAELILEINEKLSKIIGINQCSRSTCVKPAGSTSCLLGSASGIHPHHAKRYFRRVQANVNETPLQYFQLHNPRAVEKSVWSNTGTDLVITFLCEVPDGAKLKNQINATQLLEYVKLTQQNWVEYGTRKNQPVANYLRHNVSNTITVKENEWEDVTKFIFENRKWFAGISLLPMSGDLDYPQAPFAQVLDSREILQEFGEGSLFASGLIVDGLKAFDDNLWAACDCALGVGEKLQLSEQQSKLTNGMLKQVVDKLALKEEWIRRFKQFAERYCNGNYRRCTHLLKYVSNYKLWIDLKREYQEVDWSLCQEDDFRIDVTTLAGAACSGPNGCEMK